MAELQLTPPRKERLADKLYGQILEQILNGAFKEGDRLPPENDICSAFSVSRPVVRQALIRLQADGLVYSRRGSGTFVRAVPPSAITRFVQPSNVAGYLKSFEVRFALEAAAASLAAERRSSQNLHNLDEANALLREKIMNGESPSEADFDFHREVAVASGNDLFVSLFEHLRGEISGSMGVALGLTKLGSDERRIAVLREHQQIVDAIQAKNGEHAALYMRYHLLRARERITDAQRDP
ncbi:FadR family transcriptional regulator [Rhizobium sp. XQZ8]|uniref:FadR/GntR family transcriptional regulator n=1 Tax=Rhizobium populisoli TaxID=2859785 RepID=UPI001C663401|nr:FadR/GntR family transcriptional regulator [Rhizobium populisoli]MBW6424283.1 FadR family transcriptional regulator [Rhizobium populisoli]